MTETKRTIETIEDLKWIIKANIEEIIIKAFEEDWTSRLLKTVLDTKNAQNIERIAWCKHAI